MFDLTKLITGRQQRPPRVVLYGPHGVGKSTFANSAGAVFVPTEDGLTNLDVQAAFPLCRTLDDFYRAIEALATQNHKFAAVAVDTLDWLEKLVHDDVVAKDGKGRATMEECHGGYGKAYKVALAEWHRILSSLDALRDKGMAVILLAHARVVEYQNPMGESYDRYQLDLHSSKSVSIPATIMEWSDCVLFASYKVFTRESLRGDKQIGIGTGERVMFTEERPAYQAKNRYSLPPELPLSWGALIEAMKGTK